MDTAPCNRRLKGAPRASAPARRTRLPGAVLFFCALAVPLTAYSQPATPIPLTNARLRQLALKAGIGRDRQGRMRSGVLLNRAIGRALQDFALHTVGLPESTKRFPSPQRLAATTPGPQIANVVPDGVRNVVEVTQLAGPLIVSHSQASWFEVKAVRGPLRLSTSRYQILGLINALSILPFGPSHGARPMITFVTTEDTAIIVDVIDRATQNQIALWHILAYEVPGTGQTLPGPSSFA